MRCRLFVLASVAASWVTTFWVVPASAEPIRCSAFLHNQDGSWRSFYEADLIGPDGPVHIHAGEKLSSSWPSPKGDIARALDELCEEPE